MHTSRLHGCNEGVLVIATSLEAACHQLLMTVDIVCAA